LNYTRDPEILPTSHHLSTRHAHIIFNRKKI